MKLIFKITAVLFIINIFNIISSMIFLIYNWIGLFEINNYFLENMFIYSVFAIFPLSWVLIESLTIKDNV